MQITSAEELRLIFQENTKLRCEIKEIQADYEKRLKADMVAMLTEIQLEIEELDPSGNEWSDSLDACNEVIQQKINELKAEAEET